MRISIDMVDIFETREDQTSNLGGLMLRNCVKPIPRYFSRPHQCALRRGTFTLTAPYQPKKYDIHPSRSGQ